MGTRILAVVVVSATLIAGCSKKAASDQESPTPTARPNAEANPRRMPDGFQNTKWGMTKEQVQALQPKAKREGVGLVYVDELFNKFSYVQMFFDHGSLNQVWVSLPVAEVLPQVVAALEQKYGPPDFHEASTGCARWGRPGDKTAIAACTHPDNYGKPVASIMYVSGEEAERMAQAEEDRQNENRDKL